MAESYKINIVVGDDGEGILEFENDNENVICIKLDGKEIGRADWNDNLKPAFKRMLDMWGN